MNVIGTWDDRVIGRKFLSTYGFVIGGVEGTYLLYFIVSFDGTIYYVGSPCVGPKIRDIMTTYKIYLMNLNE